MDNAVLQLAELHVGSLRRIATDTGPDRPAPALDALLALVHDIEPKTQLEVALAFQIAAAHATALDQLGMAREAEDPQSAGEHISTGAQLQQSMAALVDALARLRAFTPAESAQ